MEKNRSILVMNNGYLASSLSGGTRNALDIAKELTKQHRVCFVLPDFAKEFLPDGVTAADYPSSLPRSLPGIVFTYLIRMVKASRVATKKQADIVLCSSSLLHDMLPAWVHRKKNQSHMAVFVYHLIPRRKGKNLQQRIQFALSSAAQWLCIRFYRSADTVFAGNSVVKAQLVDAGIPEERIQIYFPAVRIEEIQATPPRSEYDLLFVGRLVARKGIFDLIQAVEPLDCTVGIIGEGEAKADVAEILAEKGLDKRIHLLGGLPDADMFALLRGSKTFVFPSYEEGYGIALAEALAAGIPVITYELPHYREAFEDGPVYVQIGDVDNLRNSIESVLSQQNDSEKPLSPNIQTAASAAKRALDFMERSL